ARAVATASGLINDPFAAPLVHAVGVELLARVVDGELDLAQLGTDGGFPRIAELFAARTRFFDNFFADATRAGIRQAVILASGLDTRAYRLWWPADTTLYEVDQPRVIEFKTATMRAMGAAPSLNRRAVGIDLRHHWPAALLRVGFDTTAPTTWLAEGLLIGFLPPDAQDRLLDNVTELSAAGSRLAADHALPPSQRQAAHEQWLAERWRQRGLDIDFTSLIYPGERNDVARYLAARGWVTTESGIADLFAAARLPRLSARDLDGAPAAIGYLRARRK
ncbi:MAG: SAM-dependent methyltransferase, partial [Mycobacterium sp.]